ncbi:protein SODIUM POTASSIUM ROOT DEFECTIVE 2-like [Carica papaya]|uniref:protein SODIUM POTASSIUM ROOT DEFECTIVE 2-like n=1 Tax=Carica papaya TaxID=3649 RepID=UPI000B8CCFE8|nr:protein SODIUM POTASSIUM ROOT DEFECTIVE 2-like [Carica papaya]
MLCTSQASTAICLSMDQIVPSSSPSSSSSSTDQLGGRAIDRHNPIIRDGRRFTRPLTSPPCTSQPPPINPKPYQKLPKPKKSSADAKKKTKASNNDKKQLPIADNPIKPIPSDASSKTSAYNKPITVDFFTPPGSSRYLLSELSFLDYDPVFSLVPAAQTRNNDMANSKPSSSSSSSSSDQVVVLRVSLHCRGCEGKVRKHLSRMQGVTSFNIDFAAKKVTVTGNVTPLGVLASISKVKNAQFWPSAPAASAPTIKK